MQDKIKEIANDFIALTGNIYWLEEMTIDDYIKLRNQALTELQNNRHYRNEKKSILPEKKYINKPIESYKIDKQMQTSPIINEAKPIISFEEKKEQKILPEDIDEDDEIDELAILAALGDD